MRSSTDSFRDWHPLRMQALIAALTEVRTFALPADKVLSDTLRDYPQLGQRDRAFVAETYYQILRHWRRLSRWAESDHPRHLLLAWWVVGQGWSVARLANQVSDDEAKWLAQRKAAMADYAWHPAERWSVPDWLWERLVAAYGEAEALSMAQSLAQPAPFDLRVNTLKTTREAVLAIWHREGVEAEPTPWSPWGVRVQERLPLQHHPLYRDGLVEVQDEGSQLVTQLVAPRRRQTVVDFCAGAGGKTLALAAMMGDSGQIYALDAIPKRLAGLRPRLARAGASNVQPWVIAHERDPKLLRLAGKADRVLVDVPCSGIGTLRRNPDFKWRQNEATLQQLARTQRSILAAAAELVKPCGRVVYVTCSILPEENDEVVRAFLADHPHFRLEAAAEQTATWRHASTGEPFVNGPQPQGGLAGALRLFPSVHGCDGFFAALLTRRCE